jgi:hypothetical protein
MNKIAAMSQLLVEDFEKEVLIELGIRDRRRDRTSERVWQEGTKVRLSFARFSWSVILTRVSWRELLRYEVFNGSTARAELGGRTGGVGDDTTQ